MFVSGLAAVAIAFPSAAMAQGFSGNWPGTVSGSQRSNGSYCLTLKDDGSLGYRHSGAASLVVGNQKFPYGTFQIINHVLVATIEVQGYGQNAAFLFITPVNHGSLKNGVYEDAYGGEDFDSGALSFGAKNGC
jgi:hypothetical protein